jgi:hypothetical protein
MEAFCAEVAMALKRKALEATVLKIATGARARSPVGGGGGVGAHEGVDGKIVGRGRSSSFTSSSSSGDADNLAKAKLEISFLQEFTGRETGGASGGFGSMGLDLDGFDDAVLTAEVEIRSFNVAKQKKSSVVWGNSALKGDQTEIEIQRKISSWDLDTLSLSCEGSACSACSGCSGCSACVCMCSGWVYCLCVVFVVL